MTQEERYKITSNDYVDFIIEYNRNLNLLDIIPNSTIQIINPTYAIAYAPASILNSNFINQYGIAPIPHCYGLMSTRSLEASGVQRLRRLPGFNFRGEGVLTAIIDTGIEYTNPIFINADGTTKIAALWDQTIDSEDQYPENTFYGTEYTNEQINQALNSSNPFSIVPSTDDDGHGTMLAGIATGSEVPASNFSGVAPDSELIIVKLKQAKQVFRDFYVIPADVPCYQGNDILWALTYVAETAKRLNRPISICIGLGTNQGSHDGRGPLSDTISFYADLPGFAISIAAGNEGNTGNHFFSSVDPVIGYSTAEINVGANEPGFTMELWGYAPDTYSIDITSPTGEYISRIPEGLYVNREIRFVFESTVINVDYRLIEIHSGSQLILIRFRNPTPGIWRIQVYGRGNIRGAFHIWLPISSFIQNDTFFIQPNPYTTITSPGNTVNPITITAYNPNNDALFPEASKGYTRIDDVKPDLTAPGMNVVVPTLNNGFTTASGTGIAAAHVAGINALLLEWGVVRGFYPGLNSISIKKYLIRGARRSNIIIYPNRDWGYGIVDLYNALNILRTGFPNQ